MQAPVAYKIGNETFWLSAQRCVFWEREQALILSDLHFGKTGHFRKAGIAVPQTVFKEDLQRLVALIDFFKPQQVIAVGDLFHSAANLELELFKRWRSGFPHLRFHLVKGNHDILKKDWYTTSDIILWDNQLQMRSIRFTHEICATDGKAFSFCGHLHPGVVLHGLGKQSLRFPCFYFTKDHCILPAFSRFTGTAQVDAKKAASVYAIVDQALVKL
jgi:DNA ligase-associated metallophosphoesterase